MKQNGTKRMGQFDTDKIKIHYKSRMVKKAATTIAFRLPEKLQLHLEEMAEKMGCTINKAAESFLIDRLVDEMGRSHG